ncbi:LicD family protein [Enterococcus avium]|uniref:LicD family protein n=1 Tax=Enterococcus avium TaxID=33945 RepID=UPI003461CC78
MNIKKIQNEINSIFKEVKKICDKYELTYFAIGGTCLGAVRHSGFIPWDDDLDIALPRADYEKLKIYLKRDLTLPFELREEKSIYFNECVYSKVHKVTTTFIQENLKNYPERDSGIFIDIMPLDGIPENKFERKMFFFRLKALLLLNRTQKFGFFSDNSRKSKFLARITWFAKYFPKNYFLNSYLKEVKKYDFYDSDSSAFLWSFAMDRITFKTEDFRGYVETDFEDGTIRVPKGFDTYLRNQYGNYMELPSEENRVPSHKAEKIDIHNSYKYYRENLS